MTDPTHLPTQPHIDPAAEQLHESETRFSDAFHYAAIGKALIGLDGRILEVNPALCAMFGYSAAELCTLNFRDITHPDDIEQTIVSARALVLGEIPAYQLEKRYLHRDRHIIHVRISVSLVRTSQGVPRYFVSQLQDITAFKRMEAELRASEARYRTLVEQLPAIVYTAAIDAASSTTYVSPQISSILGFTADEWMNDPELWLKQVHPEDQAAMRATVLAAHASHTPTTVEFRTLTRDGQVIWLQDMSAVVRDDAGQPLLLQGLMFDITARKQAEIALVEERALLEQRVTERTSELAIANVALGQALRLKDEFLANISHELRTPLAQIIGMAERLLDSAAELGAADQRQLVERIIARSHHLLSLIKDVLDLSRLSTGDLTLARAPVSVVELLDFTVHFVTRTATLKRLSVVTHHDPRAVMVYADGQRLKQILYKLLSNAVKFTPEGGDIGLDVAADPDAGTIAFTVWDSGIGIGAEQLPQLFEPFVQAEGHLARPHEGAGIGLALVRRLVELHGGQISVESAPGAGSRFIVVLPWHGEGAAPDE